MKLHKIFSVCVFINLPGFFHVCLMSLHPGFVVCAQEIVVFTDASPDAHFMAESAKIYGSLLPSHTTSILEIGADGTVDSLVGLSGMISLESLGSQACNNPVIDSA